MLQVGRCQSKSIHAPHRNRNTANAEKIKELINESIKEKWQTITRIARNKE